MEPDVIDSLFFAMKMNQLTQASAKDQEKRFKRLLKITGKAWVRHWKRVQKAIDQGNVVLTIPPRLRDMDGRFNADLVDR